MDGHLPPRLLRIRETAEILRISQAQCYNLINQGKLPAIRISERRLVVDQKDLERYIERQRINEPSQLMFMIDGLLGNGR